MSSGTPIGATNATSGNATWTIKPSGATNWSIQNIWSSGSATVALTDGTNSVPLASLGQSLYAPNQSAQVTMTWSITYPGVFSSGQLTATTLPASDPTVSGAMLVSHTYVSASDAPVFTGPQPVSSEAKVFRFDISGPVGSPAGTINWRMVKNGTQVATGATASQTVSDYWEAAFFFTSLVNGDVLGIQLWLGTATTAKWDWWGYICEPTQIVVAPGTYWNPLTFKMHYIQDAIALYSSPPTRGFLNTPAHGQTWWIPWSLNLLSNYYNYTTGVQDQNISMSFFEFGDANGIYRLEYGDLTVGNTISLATANATYTAFAGCNDLPSQIQGTTNVVTGITYSLPLPQSIKVTSSLWLTITDTSGLTNNMGYTGVIGP